MRYLLACFILLILVGGISCTKRISSSEVDGNLRVNSYLPEGGGDLTWTSTGLPFKIHFIGDSPCPGKDPSAEARGTATCSVAKNVKGTFAYQVLPTMAPEALVKPGDVHPCRITPCNNCLLVHPPGGMSPTGVVTVNGEGQQDVVYCDGGKTMVYTDPLPAASGETAQWLALGTGDPVVAIAFSNNDVCEGGNPAKGGTVSCKVKVQPGDYKYTATLAGCGSVQTATLHVH